MGLFQYCIHCSYILTTRALGPLVSVCFLFPPSASSDADLDLTFCGVWRHGNNALSVNIHLTPGCDEISILADKFFLSINGRITSHCRRCEMIPHDKLGLDLEKETNFCLYWEPLVDQLTLQVNERRKREVR